MTQSGPRIHVSPAKSKQRRRSAETANRKRRRRMLLEQLEDRNVMATFNVTAGVADGAAGSLRAAIIAANSNNQDDTINLAAGTYVLTQWLSVGEYNKSLSFVGEGAATTIVDANHTGRVFGAGYGATVSFDGMKITGGGSVSSQPQGAGIYGYNSHFTISNSEITGNYGDQGGGIYVDGGTLTISNAKISNNNSGRQGGGVYSQGATVTISDSTVSNNAIGVYDGGGMYLWNSTVSLNNSIVQQNVAPRDGGGVAVQGGSLAVTGGKISNNSAANTGGGIYLNAPTSAVNITGATISSNQALMGGGIFRSGGSHTMTLTESTIADNKATSPGYGDGGGILSYQAVAVVRSTVSGNTAALYGGGINAGSQTLTVDNSTISGNSAANGGGVYLSSGNTASSVLNSTIANNSSTSAGGGMFVGSYSSVVFRNSILAGNSAGSGTVPDFGGYANYTITSQGYNLFSSSSITSLLTGTTTGNKVGVNPLLGPLANNGGSTKTHALPSNSPAIDAGHPTTYPTVDQRNQSRPQDGDKSGSALPDIGAYEYTVEDPAPEAAGDTYTAIEDTLLTVPGKGVLTNDTGSPLTAILVQGSKDGTVKLNSDGSFSFQPAADFAGETSFTYKVSNGSKESAKNATVTIKVDAVNDAPVAFDDSFTLDEDTCLNSGISLRANDGDIDNAQATLKISLVPSSVEGLTLNNDGTFTYISPSNFHGTVKFDYLVSDGKLSDTGSVTLTVTPVEDDPFAADDSYTTAEDETLTIPPLGLLANDFDVDDGNNSNLTIASVAFDEQYGALTVNANGSFEYVPVTNFSGTFSFSYKTTDGMNESGNGTVTITVTPVNDAPTALDDTGSTNEDTVLTIGPNGVLENDLDPDIGDLLTVTQFNSSSAKLAAVSVNPDGSFSYDPAGSKDAQQLHAGDSLVDTFGYTLTDSGGVESTAVVSITVYGVDDLPIAMADSYLGFEDTPLIVNAAAGLLHNDVDLDGDVLTAVWDSGPQDGTLNLDPDGSFVFTPNTNFNGLVSFTYRVSDGTYTSDPQTVNLTISPINDPPLAFEDTSGPTNENTALTISKSSVLANDVDPDLIYGDVLTVTLIESTSDRGATIKVNPDGSVNYDPATSQDAQLLNAGETLTDTFTYRITDIGGQSSTAVISVTVTGVDDLPITVADSYLGVEDTQLIVSAASGLLANDFDLDGDTLTVASHISPSQGSLVIQPNGSFVFTPNANINGVVAFTYRITDGTYTSEPQTVMLTIAAVNDPPVAADDSVAANSRNVLVVNSPGMLMNDLDPDLTDVASTEVLSAVVATLQSTLGVQVTIHANGSIEYDPRSASALTGLAVGATVVDTFDYTLRDAAGLQDTGLVSITVTGVPEPPIGADDAYTVEEDSTINITANLGILANDLLDNDVPLTAVLVTGPQHGNLEMQSDGSFIYIADQNYSGVDTFTYKSNDGTTDSEEITVTFVVRPRNDAPTTTELENIDVVMNGNIEDLNLLDFVDDVDNRDSDLQFTVSSDNENLVDVREVGGILQFTVGQDRSGTAHITVTVRDANGGETELTFSVIVGGTNDPPVWRTGKTIEVYEGTVVTTIDLKQAWHDDHEEPYELGFDFLGTGDPIVVPSLAEGGLLTLAWVPHKVGETTLTMRAQDWELGRGSQVITLRVLPLNRAPMLNQGPIVIQEGMDVTFPIQGLDPNDDDLTYTITDGPSWVTVQNGKDLRVQPGYDDGEKVWNVILRATDDGDPSYSFTQVLGIRVTDKDRYTLSYDLGLYPEEIEIEMEEGENRTLTFAWDSSELTGDPDAEDLPTFTYFPGHVMGLPGKDSRPEYREAELNAKFNPRLGGATKQAVGELQISATELDGGKEFKFTILAKDNHPFPNEDPRAVWQTYTVKVTEKNELPAVYIRNAVNTSEVNGVDYKSVNERKKLTFDVIGVDPDRFGEHVQIEMTNLDGAAATFNGTTFTFEPWELEGGSKYRFKFWAPDSEFTDSQNPGREIEITVVDTNENPSITSNHPYVRVDPDETASYTVSALDGDIPIQTLSFSAGNGENPEGDYPDQPDSVVIPLGPAEARIEWTPHGVGLPIAYRTSATVTDIYNNMAGLSDTVAVPVGISQTYCVEDCEYPAEGLLDEPYDINVVPPEWHEPVDLWSWPGLGTPYFGGPISLIGPSLNMGENTIAEYFVVSLSAYLSHSLWEIEGAPEVTTEPSWDVHYQNDNYTYLPFLIIGYLGMEAGVASISWRTVPGDGENSADSSDFIPATGVITANDAFAQVVWVPVLHDDLDEGVERMQIELFDASSGNDIVYPIAPGDIDDAPRGYFNVSDAANRIGEAPATNEPEYLGHEKQMYFDISREPGGGPDRPAMVKYRIIGGEQSETPLAMPASPGEDFFLKEGTLMLARGESQRVSTDIYYDGIPEGIENVRIEIYVPDDYGEEEEMMSILDGVGVGYIHDYTPETQRFHPPIAIDDYISVSHTQQYVVADLLGNDHWFLEYGTDYQVEVGSAGNYTSPNSQGFYEVSVNGLPPGIHQIPYRIKTYFDYAEHTNQLALGNWGILTVDVTNEAPYAADREYIMLEGDTLVVSDPAKGLVVGASDPDMGDIVSVATVASFGEGMPGEIVLTEAEFGTFTYHAPSAGTYVYRYKVKDQFDGDAARYSDWKKITIKVLDGRVDVDGDLNGRHGIENHDEAWEDRGEPWSAVHSVLNGPMADVALWRGWFDIPIDWTWPNGMDKTQEPPASLSSEASSAENEEYYRIVLNYSDNVFQLLNGEQVIPPGEYNLDGTKVGEPSIQLPGVAQVKGIIPKEGYISLELQGPNGQLDIDEIDVRIVDLELIVDANNDNVFLPPFNAEDIAAKLDGKPKRFPVSDHDADNDEIPDYADGFDLGSDVANDGSIAPALDFVPVVLRVSQSVSRDLATVKFTHNGSDPRLTDRRGPDYGPYAENAYSPGPGSIRLYKPNNAIRGGWDNRAVDDIYVVSDVEYRLNTFQLDHADDLYYYYYFYVEAHETGIESLTASMQPLGDHWVTAGSDSDTVKIKAEQIDLDVDSDNNNGNDAAWPHTAWEDNIEDDIHWRPGKLVRQNNGDLDADGIIDSLDGYDRDGVASNDDQITDVRAGFVPIVLSDFENLKNNPDDVLLFKFEYNASDPAVTAVDGFNQTVPGPGYLRIWKKDGTAARDKSAANLTEEPGDYIPPGEYTLDQLGGGGAVTLWIEGVNLIPGDITTQIRVDAKAVPYVPGGGGSSGSSNDWAAYDAVRVSIVYADLDTDSDNTGRYAFPALHGTNAALFEESIENDKRFPGKNVVINGGDTDRDGIIDFLDGYNRRPNVGDDDVLATIGAEGDLFTPVVVRVPYSVDLAKARFRFVYDASDPTKASIDTETGKLKLPDGIMRLWNRRAMQVRNPAAANQSTGGNYIAPWSPEDPNVYSWQQIMQGAEFSADGGLTLWVEGIIANTGPGKGKILMEIDVDGQYDLGSLPSDSSPGSSSAVSGSNSGSSVSGPSDSWELHDEIRMTLVDNISIVASNKYLQEDKFEYIKGQPGEISLEDEGAFVFSRGEGNVSGTVRFFFEIVTENLGEHQAAIYGVDYEFGSTYVPVEGDENDPPQMGSVLILAGSSDVRLEIKPLNDSQFEWDEAIRIKVVGHAGWDDLNLGVLPTGSSSTTSSPVYPVHPYYVWNEMLSMDEAILFDNDILFENDITDVDKLGGMINRNVDAVSTGLAQEVLDNGTVAIDVSQGHVTLTMPLFMGEALPTFRTDDNTHPIAAIEMKMPAGGLPNVFEAKLTFGGIVGTKVKFDTSHWNDTDILRFVIIGNDEVETALRSGHYEIDLHFIGEFHPGGSVAQKVIRHRTVRSGTELINHSDEKIGETQYGRKWWIDDLDQLRPGDGQSMSLTAVGKDASPFTYELEDLNLRPTPNGGVIPPTEYELKHLAGSRFSAKGGAAETGFALLRGDNSSAWFQSSASESFGGASKKPTIEVAEEREDWRKGTSSIGEEYRFTGAGLRGETRTASYHFTGLDPNRMYQITANWAAGPDRATNTPFRIFNAKEVGTDVSDKVVIVNQRYVGGESGYRSLGYFIPNGTTLDIEVSTLIEEARYEGSTLIEAKYVDGEIVAGAIRLGDGWDFETPKGSVSTLEQGALDKAIPGYLPQPGHLTLLDKYGGRYEFNHEGLLQNTVDRNKNRVEYEYEGRKIITVTQQGGLGTQYDYDDQGKLLSVMDFAGRVTDVVIGGIDLTEIKSPAPEQGKPRPKAMFAYNEESFTVVDAEQNTTTVTFDKDLDRAVKVQNADQYEWTLTAYNLDGIATPDKNGKVRLPASGKIAEPVIAPEETGLIEARATYEDPRSLADTKVAAYYWYYQVDNYGLATAYSKPAYDVEWQETDKNTVWKWGRNLHGLVIAAFEPAGGGGARLMNDRHSELTTTFEYDNKFNTKLIRTPDELEEKWTYHPDFSAPTDHRLPLGYYTTFVLSSNGNVRFLIEGQDGFDPRLTKFDYTPAPTGFKQRPGGLVTQETQAYGTADSVMTRMEYHEGNQLYLVSKVTSAYTTGAAATVSFKYNEQHNLAGVTDESGIVTTYKHDLLDRNTHDLLPAPGTDDHIPLTVEYQYDRLGQLRYQITSDPDGSGPRQKATAEYTYDEMGRLEDTILPPAGGNPDSQQSTFTTTRDYDANGNLESSSTGFGRTVNFKYDKRNQLRLEEYPTPIVIAPVELPPEATEAPRIQRWYDELGELVAESNPRTHFRGGVPIAPVATQFKYDVMGRLTDVVSPQSGETDAQGYTTTIYDALGRITAQIAPVASMSLWRTTVASYSYDQFNRVKTSESALNEAGSLITTYQYDLRDNLKSQTVAGSDGNGSITTTYTYDARNRLIVTQTSDTIANGEVIDNGLMTINAYSPTGVVLRSITMENDGNAGQWVTNGAGPNSNQVTQKALAMHGQDKTARLSKYTPDNLGRIVVSEAPDPDGKYALSPLRTTTKYDALGAAVQTTINYQDQAGKTSELITDYFHDDRGQLWKTLGTADSKGNRPETTTAYNNDGTLHTVAEKNVAITGAASTRVTTYGFDNLGRNYFVQSPDGLYSYTFSNAVDQTVLAIDESNWQTRTLYDRLNRPVTYQRDVVTTKLNESTESQGTNATHLYHYPNGQLHMQSNYIGPDANQGIGTPVASTRFNYDYRGQLITRGEKNGSDWNESKFNYDSLGHLDKVMDPTGYVTDYSTDNRGQILSEAITFTNVSSNTSGLTPAEGKNSVTATRHFRYDPFGQVIQTIDRNGRTIQYGYNQVGNRTRETWFNTTGASEGSIPRQLTGGAFTEVYDSLFTYSTLGEMTYASSASAQNTSQFYFQYDTLRRMASTTQRNTVVPGDEAFRITYGHDLVGNPEQRVISRGSLDGQGAFSGPAFADDKFTYDILDRLTEVNSSALSATTGDSLVLRPASKAVTFVYGIYEFSQSKSKRAISQIARYDGTNNSVLSTITTNADGRTRKIITNTGWSQSLSYDGAGRVLEEFDSETGLNVNKYDGLGQLVQVEDADGNILNKHLFDSAGNRLPAPGVQVPHDRLSFDGTNRYDQYDAEGNLLQKTTYREIPVLAVSIAGEADAWFPGNPYMSDESANSVSLGPGDYRVRIDPIELRYYTNPQRAQVTVRLKSPGLADYVFAPVIRRPSQVGTDVWRTQPIELPFENFANIPNATIEVEVKMIDLNDSIFGAGADNVVVQGIAHVDKADMQYHYTWDYQNRLDAATAFDMGSGTEQQLYSVDYVYDVLGNLVGRVRTSNGPSGLSTTYNREEYFVVDGNKKPLVINGAGQVETYNLYAPAVDLLLAVDDFDYSSASAGTQQLIWPLADAEGTIQQLNWANASSGTPLAQTRQRLHYDAFNAPERIQIDGNEDTLAEAVDIRANGWYWDPDAEVYFVNGQVLDPFAGRLLSENRGMDASRNRYTFSGNDPNAFASRPGDIGLKASETVSLLGDYGTHFDGLYGQGAWKEANIRWHEFTYYFNPVNNWQDGNHTLAIVQGSALAVAATAGAAIAALQSPGVIAASFTYAGAAGMAAGAADGGLTAMATGHFDPLNMAMSMAGGAINPLSGIGSLAGGLAGAAAEYEMTGKLTGRGYLAGSIAAGIATGGIDDFRRSGMLMHALARVGVETGFTAAGGVIGYENGGIDGMLAGAALGQSIGSVAGHFAVPCFPAGTLIETEHGSVPIEQLKRDDRVASRDEHYPEGAIEFKQIEECFVRQGEILHLHIVGEVIRTTPEHPFYVVGGGWTAAGELLPGDRLATISGEPVVVEEVFWTGECATVYNLRVADFHTYFVTATSHAFSAWVHNAYDPKLNSFRSRHAISEPSGTKYTTAYARQLGTSTGSYGVSPNTPVSSRFSIGKRVFESMKSALGFGGPVLSHAEHAAIRRLWLQNGRKALGTVELFTDRPLCPYPGGCQKSLHRVLSYYGVDEVRLTQGNANGHNLFLIRPNLPATSVTSF